MTEEHLRCRLRVAGIAILAGLGVEMATLAWSSPAAFLVFILLGASLVGLGVVVFLVAGAALGEPADSAG